jgi:uncharacterized protein (TIGR02996 family)
MSTRDDLEDALHVRPDDHTLLVYADLLQAQGDPRGELIALDLRSPAMSMQSIETRRGQLLRQWLGDDIELELDAAQQLWYAGDLEGTYATFDCGFVDLFVKDDTDYPLIGQLLRTPAGAYLRRLSISGVTIGLEWVLANLIVERRPWLQQLAISRTHGLGTLVDDDLARDLVRVTPHLEVLDLLGRDLFTRFAHPNVRELGITGCASIDLIDGPPFASLRTIDFALNGADAVPRKLFDATRVPALRSLSCAREEPGTRLFEALGEIGVAAQLTHLVLPSIRTPRDHALVQAALDRMPMLREIEIARLYGNHQPMPELRHPWARVKLPRTFPWPPPGTVDRLLAIDAFSTDLNELIEVLEEQYNDLSFDHRGIWDRFWMSLDFFEERAFSTLNLATALEGLELPPHLAALRAHLRSRVAEKYLAMRWV